MTTAATSADGVVVAVVAAGRLTTVVAGRARGVPATTPQNGSAGSRAVEGNAAAAVAGAAVAGAAAAGAAADAAAGDLKQGMPAAP
jgi:hypothetical protein